MNPMTQNAIESAMMDGDIQMNAEASPDRSELTCQLHLFDTQTISQNAH